MFNNIGGKIKLLAKILCWVGIVLSVITGVAILASGNTAYVTINGEYTTVSNVPTGISIIVVGCLLSWIGSFFTYGFGQLIENSDIIRNEMQRKD